MLQKVHFLITAFGLILALLARAYSTSHAKNQSYQSHYFGIDYGQVPIGWILVFNRAFGFGILESGRSLYR